MAFSAGLLSDVDFRIGTADRRRRRRLRGLAGDGDDARRRAVGEPRRRRDPRARRADRRRCTRTTTCRLVRAHFPPYVDGGAAHERRTRARQRARARDAAGAGAARGGARLRRAVVRRGLLLHRRHLGRRGRARPRPSGSRSGSASCRRWSATRRCWRWRSPRSTACTPAACARASGPACPPGCARWALKPRSPLTAMRECVTSVRAAARRRGGQPRGALLHASTASG